MSPAITSWALLVIAFSLSIVSLRMPLNDTSHLLAVIAQWLWVAGVIIQLVIGGRFIHLQITERIDRREAALTKTSEDDE